MMVFVPAKVNKKSSISSSASGRSRYAFWCSHEPGLMAKLWIWISMPVVRPPRPQSLVYFITLMWVERQLLLSSIPRLQAGAERRKYRTGNPARSGQEIQYYLARKQVCRRIPSFVHYIGLGQAHYHYFRDAIQAAWKSSRVLPSEFALLRLMRFYRFNQQQKTRSQPGRARHKWISSCARSKAFVFGLLSEMSNAQSTLTNSSTYETKRQKTMRANCASPR